MQRSASESERCAFTSMKVPLLFALIMHTSVMMLVFAAVRRVVKTRDILNE